LRLLHDVVVAACCQCGRNRLPSIQATETLHRGLAEGLAGATAGILLDPNDAEPPTAVLSGSGPFALAVGPEGGLDDAEQSLALRMGYRPLRLGPRILRTETAGLAGLVALQVLGGDLQ
jgi:16S rRNA (uracil1498-N3)-methyltransferase